MTRTILLLCEKPSQARRVADVAKAMFTDCIIETRSLCLGGVGPSGLSLELPKDLGISQTPIVIEPQYRAATCIGDAFSRADRVIFACDPDSRGVLMFAHHARLHRGTDEGFPALRLNWLADEHIRDEFRAGRTTSDSWFREQLRIGEARYYFNGLWAANALPLFGKLLRDIGSPEPQTFVGKSLPILLFRLKKQQVKNTPLTEEEVYTLMSKWSGSGRYAENRIGLGSPTSRHVIIEQGNRSGLLQWLPRPAKSLVLTALGEEFLRRLHPDCDDPDMIFRIETWGRDWPASRPKADRYIRTYFGKMKRHMGKFSPAA